MEITCLKGKNKNKKILLIIYAIKNLCPNNKSA